VWTEPRASYRLQLRSGFGFAEAAALVPYLAELGISHVYSAPVLQAVPGSAHGYDVIEHGTFSAELGGAAGFAGLVSALRGHGMGLLLDIVPNHMAIGVPGNAWWWDVLKHGHQSRYAAMFDIDWRPPEERLRNAILLPVLPDHYGRVLESGGLRLQRGDDGPQVAHGGARFPIDPATIPATLRDGNLEEWIAELNADPDALDELIGRQHWRLARWSASAGDLGYRRFFDVDTLIGLRVEDPAVFEATHRPILDQLRSGALDGLRVDHPDGMRDPTAYFGRLRAEAPAAWLLAEKILQPGEDLPGAWQIDGTTGYDFANLALGLFVDPAGEAPLTELYEAFSGETASWRQVARSSKLQVLRDLFGSDLERLAELFVAVCEANRRHRDHTRHQLREALAEVIASFGVYRTYARAESREVTAADARRIRAAVAEAAAHRPDIDPSLLEFMEQILTLQVAGEAGELAMRFQQLSGPAMAKGIEDTAFYRYHRFVALNEVGGDPGRFGRSVDEFDAWCAAARPRNLLAGMTHDTKRGEDVRARLAVLSQLPAEWRAAVERWSALADRHRSGDLPERNVEYLLYQTLVGAWPVSAERAVAYMRKAAREAKLRTSWLAPAARYEAALESFVRGLLDDPAFCAELAAFVGTLEDAARRTSLSLLVLRLTAPGVPDIYQGSELGQWSLVDPDNRGPVDYELRGRLLAEASVMTDAQAWEGPEAGIAKLWLLGRVLALRARRPEAFAGAYRPLAADGAQRDRVIAFSRGESLAVVAPRLVVGLESWGDTSLALPEGSWRDVLSDRGAEGTVPLGELLATFPVAVLERS